MSTDPYRDWLGIQEPARPLNHYQLLGLPLGEADAAKIETAAERQLARLAPHAQGAQGRLAKRTQFEIESARQCLLDAATRASYDDGLRQQGKAMPAPQRQAPAPAKSAPAPAADEFSLAPLDEPKARAASRPTPAKPAGPAAASASAPRPSAQPVRPAAQPASAARARPVECDLDAISAMPANASPIKSTRARQREEEEEAAKKKQLVLIGSAGAGFLVLCVLTFVGVRSFRSTAQAAPGEAGTSSTGVPSQPQVPIAVPSGPVTLFPATGPSTSDTQGAVGPATTDAKTGPTTQPWGQPAGTQPAGTQPANSNSQPAGVWTLPNAVPGTGPKTGTPNVNVPHGGVPNANTPNPGTGAPGGTLPPLTPRNPNGTTTNPANPNSGPPNPGAGKNPNPSGLNPNENPLGEPNSGNRPLNNPTPFNNNPQPFVPQADPRNPNPNPFNNGNTGNTGVAGRTKSSKLKPKPVTRIPTAPPPLAAESGPFALFPRNVELPALVGELPKPVALGKVNLGKSALTLDLRDGVINGKAAVRFRLQPDADNPSQWLVMATPAPTKKIASQADGEKDPEKEKEAASAQTYKVGRFTLLSDGILEFAWLEEATSIAASPLRNCVLNMEAREEGVKNPLGTRELALRCAQVSSLTRLDREKDEMTVPIKGEALPERAALRLQLVELRGFPDGTQVTPENFTVAFREEMKVVVRPADVEAPGIELRFWIESLASGSVVKVGAVAVDTKGETMQFSQGRVETMNKTIPRELREGAEDLVKLQNEYGATQFQLRNLGSSSDAQEQGKINFTRQSLNKRLGRLSDSIASKQKRLTYMSWMNSLLPDLTQVSTEMQDKAEFDFRVFFVVDGREVDVLSTR